MHALPKPDSLLVVFGIGYGAGMASWFACWLLSGKFEPFDSDVGFWASQAFSSVVMGSIGWHARRFLSVVVGVLGIYLGQIFYVYTFGGSESRAWILLAAFGILVLSIFPTLTGVFAFGARKIWARRKKLKAISN